MQHIFHNKSVHTFLCTHCQHSGETTWHWCLCSIVYPRRAATQARDRVLGCLIADWCRTVPYSTGGVSWTYVCMIYLCVSHVTWNELRQFDSRRAKINTRVAAATATQDTDWRHMRASGGRRRRRAGGHSGHCVLPAFFQPQRLAHKAARSRAKILANLHTRVLMYHHHNMY